MPFIEYMLLAILGASPAATTEGTPSMRTITADAITQPSGGVEDNLDFSSEITMLGQDTGGCKGMAKAGTGKKPLTHQRVSARRHRRHHNKVIKESGTRNAGHKG